MKIPTIIIVLIAWSIYAYPQNSELYMPGEISQAYKKNTRSYDGKPGKNYWLNTAEYDIKASFDPESLIIDGTIEITYFNNSPDTLTRLVLKLKQNQYRKGAFRDTQVSPENITDGVGIRNIKILASSGNIREARFNTYGTLLFIRLTKSEHIKPGKSISFSLEWDLKMPGFIQLRSGKVHDDSYFISYWFPQMSVYDDISEWDTKSYTGVGETYNDLAHYKVNITVPGKYYLWATGNHLNQNEVFKSEFINRLEQSKLSDEVIHLLTSGQTAADILKPADERNWKFEATGVPDFAFALSSDYLWDATSAVTNSTTGARTWLNVVYPLSSSSFYKMGAETAKKAVEYFSTTNPGIAFPYEKQTTVYGDFESGMEFPMLALDGEMGSDTSDFYDLIGHEIAHSYFPFSVNTNEKMYAWMDESWTTIFGVSFAMSQGFHKPPFFANLDKAFWNSFRDLPPMIPTNNVKQLENMHIAYIRPKFAILFLLDMFQEKGKENPTKEYYSRWEGKHPTPYDFFFTMNDLFGEDLSWYLKPWFFEFCSPDLGIERVLSVGDKTRVFIENVGGMPLPVIITFHFEDGTTEQHHKSAYIWKGDIKSFYVNMSAEDKITKITLGDKTVPDFNPENNVWLAPE